MVNNIYLNLDAFHGDKDHGGVRDGTLIVLWEWCKGHNQSWKIQPWGGEASQPPAYGGHSAAPVYDQYRGSQSSNPGGYPTPGLAPGYGCPYGQPGGHFTVRIFCRADEGYSLTIKDGNVCLTRTDANDDFQVRKTSVLKLLASAYIIICWDKFNNSVLFVFAKCSTGSKI